MPPTPLMIETGQSFTIPGTGVTIVWTGEPISTLALTALTSIFGDVIAEAISPVTEYTNRIVTDPGMFGILQPFFDLLFGETRISEEKDRIEDLQQPYFEMLHDSGWSNDRGGHFDQFSDARSTLQEDPHIWEQANHALALDGPGICEGLWDGDCPTGYAERFTYQWWVNAWGDGWNDTQRINAWNGMLLLMGITPRAWPTAEVVRVPGPGGPPGGGPGFVPPPPPPLPVPPTLPPPPPGPVPTFTPLPPEQVAYIRSTGGLGQGYLDYVASQTTPTYYTGEPAHFSSQGWEWYYYPDHSILDPLLFIPGNIVYAGGRRVHPGQIPSGLYAPHEGGPPQVLEVPPVPQPGTTLPPQPIDCPIGTHWDPVVRWCVPNPQKKPPPHCPPGMHWDEGRSMCVPDVVPVFCPPGFHRDPLTNTCVPDPPPPPPPEDDPCDDPCIQAAIDRKFDGTIEYIDRIRDATAVDLAELRQADRIFDGRIQLLEAPDFQGQIDGLGHQQNLDRQFDGDWNQRQDDRLRDLDRESRFRDQSTIDVLAPQIGEVARRAQECCDRLTQDNNQFWRFFTFTFPLTLVQINNDIQNFVYQFWNENITNVYNQLTTFITQYVTNQVTNLTCYINNEVKRGVEAFYIHWCDIGTAKLGLMQECWYEKSGRSQWPGNARWDTEKAINEASQAYSQLVRQQSTGRWKDDAARASLCYKNARAGFYTPGLGHLHPLHGTVNWIYDPAGACEREQSFTGFRTPQLLSGEKDPVKKPEKC